MTSTPLVETTSSLRVPPELFRIIFTHLTDCSTLRELTLSSNLLRLEAEHLLYASPMTLAPSPFTNPFFAINPTDNPAIHESFLRTITANPRLASLVRSYYSLNVLSSEEYSELKELTRQGLIAMSGLKELIIGSRSTWEPMSYSLLLGIPKVPSSTPLKTVSPSNGIMKQGEQYTQPSFKLHRFYWWFRHEEEDIVTFLREQPQLLHLQLNISQEYKHLFSVRHSPFSSQALVPCLESVGGSIFTVEALLPGRNVIHATSCEIPWAHTLIGWVVFKRIWGSSKHIRLAHSVTGIIHFHSGLTVHF